MRKLITSIGFILISITILHAQPDSDFKHYTNKYPEEDIVKVLSKQTLYADIVNGEISIYYEKYNEDILLKDNYAAYGNEKIYYSSYDSLVSIEAYSLVPNGKGYKKVNVTNFSYSSDVNNSIFYDDTKVCKFVYSNLTKGSKIVYKTRKKLKTPFYIPTFYFSKIIATEKSEVEFILNRLINLDYNKIAISEDKLKTSITNTKKQTRIFLEMDNIPYAKFESNVNDYIQYLPHIIPRITTYQTNSKSDTIKVLPSLDYLHKFYYSFIDTINRNEYTEIKLMADSITANASSEFEKVKLIYYWVQHNIRYIAFEDGDNGLIPMDAGLVFSKRYGDCKGMSNLIIVMLGEIGIKSYYTWIGTNDLPYKYTEIPAPNIDNHMIACYFDTNGKAYFLDATAEFQSINSTPRSIQGKECLVSIDKNTYKIIEIPYDSYNVFEHSTLNIDSNIINIQSIFKFSGNAKKKAAYFNAHRTDNEKRNLFAEELADINLPKTTIYSVSHSDLYAVDDTLTFTYKYSLNDYILRNENNLYFKIPNLNTIDESVDIEKRIHNYELKEKQHFTSQLKIEIPKNYNITYIPKNVIFTHPLFSFTAEINTDKNFIHINSEYITNFITLPKDDYVKWNAMIKIIRQFYNQSIVFEKIK